jgi:uncharacterized protein (TIGR03083 family)
MTEAEYLDAVTAEVKAFSESVAGADLKTPVPTCPPWDLAQLIKHLGLVHLWAQRMVKDLAQERLDFKRLLDSVPVEESAYPAWFAAGGDQLLAVLRAAHPDAGMWAWGADQHVRFWLRRMAHETAVHLADADLALGRRPSFEASAAVDAIDEFLENLPHAVNFAPNVKDLQGNGESIHFHCTDTEGEWLIELHPDGFHWQHGHGKGSAAVRGSAADLVLLMYGRNKYAGAGFEVFGDTAVLDRWFANAHI